MPSGLCKLTDRPPEVVGGNRFIVIDSKTRNGFLGSRGDSDKFPAWTLDEAIYAAGEYARETGVDISTLRIYPIKYVNDQEIKGTGIERR